MQQATRRHLKGLLEKLSVIENEWPQHGLATIDMAMSVGARPRGFTG
jgi:hypothetical protein